MINAILAIADNGVIGNNNKLPWPHNSEDLGYFKRNTKNQSILCGRSTYESFPKRPLPDRVNFVLSKTQIFPETISVSNLTEFLNNWDKELPLWIVGGKQVYEQSWPWVETVLLTRFKGEFIGDTFMDMNTLLQEFKKCKNSIESTEGTCIWERWTRKNVRK